MGCGAWSIETSRSPRFVGNVWNSSNSKTELGLSLVQTTPACQSVSLFSNLPIIAGLYDTQGKTGVYYEVCIKKMDGLIAIGKVKSSSRGISFQSVDIFRSYRYCL